MIYESVGMYASLMGFSPEGMVLGNDLIGQAQRCVRGIDVTEDALSLDVMKAVCLDGGPGHYLGSDQTLALMQTEYLYPDIGNRLTPKDWVEAGKPDLIEAARTPEGQYPGNRRAVRCHRTWTAPSAPFSDQVLEHNRKGRTMKVAFIGSGECRRQARREPSAQRCRSDGARPRRRILYRIRRARREGWRQPGRDDAGCDVVITCLPSPAASDTVVTEMLPQWGPRQDMDGDVHDRRRRGPAPRRDWSRRRAAGRGMPRLGRVPPRGYRQHLDLRGRSAQRRGSCPAASEAPRVGASCIPARSAARRS
jgi:hypothetical protein